VINLLTNACQALPARDKAIRISTFSAAGGVGLEIADQGAGIAPEALSHVYDPFFTTKRDSGGTGLGLAISYTIVKEHGGDISIVSEPGTGTRVTIALPCMTVGDGV
jgi:polar amino acid transport system substrate-binding protein